MSIKTLTCDHQVDPAVWDERAAALGGGFYHCHAATTYVARILGAEPLFICAMDDKGQCVGVAAGVVASRRVWPFSRYCRRASFEATPVAGGNAELECEFLRVIAEELCRLGIFRMEFSSYHSPNSNRLLVGGGYALTPRREYDIDLTRPLDELFGAFSSSRRNKVRRAEKAGVITKEVNTTQALDLVRRLHDMSMERRGIPTTPLKDSVVSARHELLSSGRIHVLVSYCQGKPEGAKTVGLFNGRAYGIESGSTDQGNRCSCPVHLTWTSMRIFKDKGASRMSLGGAKDHETGLQDFKKAFGGTETPQPAGYKTISRFGARLDGLLLRLRGRRGKA